MVILETLLYAFMESEIIFLIFFALIQLKNVHYENANYILGFILSIFSILFNLVYLYMIFKDDI